MVVEKVFAVIAESTRRDILEALAQDSKAVGQLVDELGVSQPTVSKHLRVLREAGVVTMRAQGQKRFYGINTEPLALVSTWLDSLGAGITENSVSPVAAAALGTGTTAEAPAPASGAGADAAAKPAPAAAAASGAAGLGARPVAKVPTEVNRDGLPAAQTGSAVSATVTSPSPAHVVEAVGAAVAARAQTGATASPGATSASTGAASARPVVPGTNTAAIVPRQSASAVVKRPGVVVVGNDNDGGVPRQLGRSVSRAAKKGADLFATFKRRKD